MQQTRLSFDTLLGDLGAAGEETRLRLLLLLCEAELTVSELVTILGQSQPRISRHLELLAPLAERAVGIDQSPAMLAVARARLERAGLRNVQLRQGDIYAVPVERNGYDLVILHQVLHYLDDPGRALREAARVLRPGGRLLVVDFAPHAEESLRESHAHRRLGFGHDEIATYPDDASHDLAIHRDLPPLPGGRRKPTASLW